MCDSPTMNDSTRSRAEVAHQIKIKTFKTYTKLIIDSKQTRLCACDAPDFEVPTALPLHLFLLKCLKCKKYEKRNGHFFLVCV